MRLTFSSDLFFAELERYARSIIQIDAEHVGESGGKRLAIDSEQPQPVFRKDKAIRPWLGIHRKIDGLVQSALNNVCDSEVRDRTRCALRNAIGVAHAELHVNRSIAIEHRRAIRVDRMQDLVAGLAHTDCIRRVDDVECAGNDVMA